MLSRKLLNRVSLAIAFAALSSLAVTGVGSAQTVPGPFVVRVESPASGSVATGNVTFTGLAADCGTGVPSTGVGVYDNAENGPKLADVSMDTIRQLSAACSNRTGSAQIGFTLILDTRRLAQGHHTLFFRATFAGGQTSTATTEVWVDNIAPFGRPCGYSTNQYCNNSYNGSGVYYPGAYAPYAYGGVANCIAYTVNGACQMWGGQPGAVYTGTPYYAGAYVSGAYQGCGYYGGGCPVVSNPQRVPQPCVGAPWRMCVYSVGGFTVQR